MPTKNPNRRCLGCGWAFADGGEVHETTGQDVGLVRRGYKLTGAIWICGPCNSIAGDLSNMHRPASRKNLIRMTNLLLKAIRDSGSGCSDG